MGVRVVVPPFGEGVVTGFRARDRVFRVALGWGATAYVGEGRGVFAAAGRVHVQAQAHVQAHVQAQVGLGRDEVRPTTSRDEVE